jgi:hypothetical protein
MAAKTGAASDEAFLHPREEFETPNLLSSLLSQWNQLNSSFLDNNAWFVFV